MPQDKAFSIAAALPMPCYGSMLDDLSNACLLREERLPFSQNEFSAQHIAQQLTLLQQVNTFFSGFSTGVGVVFCYPLEGDVSL